MLIKKFENFKKSEKKCELRKKQEETTNMPAIYSLEIILLLGGRCVKFLQWSNH